MAAAAELFRDLGYIRAARAEADLHTAGGLLHEEQADFHTLHAPGVIHQVLAVLRYRAGGRIVAAKDGRMRDLATLHNLQTLQRQTNQAQPAQRALLEKSVIRFGRPGTGAGQRRGKVERGRGRVAVAEPAGVHRQRDEQSVSRVGG